MLLFKHFKKRLRCLGLLVLRINDPHTSNWPIIMLNVQYNIRYLIIFLFIAIIIIPNEYLVLTSL